MALLGELRAKRTKSHTPLGGVSYLIEKRHADSLEPAARKALEAVGGLGHIANASEEQMQVIRAQYGQIYAALLSGLDGNS
jgi:hypothetical protein